MLAKRILNPDNKWLWIAGGAVVLGGSWWYFSRKKEEPALKGPTNFFLISTRAQAEKDMLKPVKGKILSVWSRSGPEAELLSLTKEAAVEHGGVSFYFFKEEALASVIPGNVVAVIAGADDGVLKYRAVVQDTSVQPSAEAVSKFQEAVLALTEPVLGGASLDEVPTIGEMLRPVVMVELV